MYKFSNLLRKMETFTESIIDPEGKFKYIQILLSDKNDHSINRTLVRGFKSCAYHNDILQKFIN